MDEDKAIGILKDLLDDSNLSKSVLEALTFAISSLENQKKLKEILDTPTLFAEKFNRICEIKNIFNN